MAERGACLCLQLATDFPRPPRRRLAIRADIQARLDTAGIDRWLRGRWAIDFLVGVVTRTHADIDLVVGRAHRDRLREAISRVPDR